MSGKGCTCIECRVRAAIREPGGGTNVKAAIVALGNVMAECLAHAPIAAAKAAGRELVEATRRWKREPRVMVQNPSEGSA